MKAMGPVVWMKEYNRLINLINLAFRRDKCCIGDCPD